MSQTQSSADAAKLSNNKLGKKKKKPKKKK